MEIKGLQGKEICNIIKACANARVKKLKIGDFEVDFLGEGTQPTFAGMPTTEPPKLGTVEEPRQLELSESDKQVFEDLEDAQMMIEDPEGYEQQIIDSHINRHKLGEVRHEANERSKTQPAL